MADDAAVAASTTRAANAARHLSPGTAKPAPAPSAAPAAKRAPRAASPAKPPETLPEGKARTTFQLVRPQGSAKCTAANGRLEIRLPRDFSAIDRRRLEAAVASLLDQID